MVDLGRFESCVERDPVFGCCLWVRGLDRDGYGVSWQGGRAMAAHRRVYLEIVGAIPEGKELDHECRRRACVRPDHLEMVTGSENQLRRLWRVRARRTHCRAGHDLAICAMVTPEGGRLCRRCQGP